ncbi:hypothetical protein QBC37DRAFT_315491 [Rhypophila decipiens]|uniref:Uncharacterized protein n=1 Tax=Rhypophila decipiens TaxID=261697 RepID=A0AAN6Y9N0_9PEZI|nr:hypothetical protein QBC37DRAFT_315491 [Rhypophila decipiens]
MPPRKRVSSEANDSSTSAPKRVASGNGPTLSTATPASKPKPKVKKTARWAKFSVSANLAAEYEKLTSEGKANPGEFICLCQVPFDLGEDASDSEAESESPEKSKPKRCDGGKTCLCKKPASENPNHKWVISSAGKVKFFQQQTHHGIRNPDNFSMYTFNDHSAYGTLEVIQNLILDFVETPDAEEQDSWKERWVVVEALGFFMKTVGDDASMIDDGELADWTWRLLGRLFLRMLTELESKSLLGPDSEVKNLGLMMTVWIDIAEGASHLSLLDESNKEAILPKGDKKFWYPHRYQDQILAYAAKYKIPLVGMSEADVQAKLGANGDDDGERSADLPVFKADDPKRTEDAFGFDKDYKSYVSKNQGVTGFLSRRREPCKSKIGGDMLDITSWSSAERKKANYKGNDPLGKKELDAIKRGGILMIT